MLATASTSKTSTFDAFDLDDDDGWQEMPVVREVDRKLNLDEEDQKKYHYVAPTKQALSVEASAAGNATGNMIDFDGDGQDWREKAETKEEEYTRLKLDDDDDADEAYLRTKYLFDEDKAMTPLSQMQATKNFLTEAQRIAYVGVCSLVARQMSLIMSGARRKELAPAVKGMELWRLRIMGRIYYHMELETDEQKMIESLGEHGVDPMDLVPALMATHIVANPEYDAAEARQKKLENTLPSGAGNSEGELSGTQINASSDPPPLISSTSIDQLSQMHEHGSSFHATSSVHVQTTANVLQANQATSVPGVSTSLSSTDENVTLDIRWTVLCDLFLILIADSVYDSRSRMLLENVAEKLGLGWLDVVRFEKRVTDALEIQEGVEYLEQGEVIAGRSKAAQKRRYVMMGLATLGGGLVIGLSAGLLAPVIGAGLGAALGTVGIGGTTAFLGGVGGAAVITTGGVLTGSGIAAKGMSRRTRQVQIFELLPIHNNKRVSCIITVPGFMASAEDDVRLPFSVLDSIVGDVFSVRWEPEMMGEMGNALKILASEVLSQVGTTVLQATVMTALMSALQWPIILTKLGYLIDNPWSNALDRAHAAGLVLADVLLNRSMGVRPITLVGFSLGARVVFYALCELAKHKAFGIVQDVFLLGATVTASQSLWLQARGVVAGRFVNGFARNDWVLNYLFRATAVGSTVAGLRPIENVPGLENVDVTDKIAGHLSYRTFMPLILDQLGFPVSATYFDEPEAPDMTQDREVVHEEAAKAGNKKKSRFGIFKGKSKQVKHDRSESTTSEPRSSTSTQSQASVDGDNDDDALPAREEKRSTNKDNMKSENSDPEDPPSYTQAKVGFDFKAIGKVLGKEDLDPASISMPSPVLHTPDTPHAPHDRSESVPPPAAIQLEDMPTPRAKSVHLSDNDSDPNPEHDRTQDVRASFHRSLSLDNTSSYLGDPPPMSSPFNNHTPEPGPSWPPPSSMLSFASSDGAAWTAPSTSTYNPPPVDAYASPLRRNAPPAQSFGSMQGFRTSAPFVVAHPAGDDVPELSFGSADGTVTALESTPDPTTRDPWAPKPLGLTSAIASTKKSASYTMNPWET